MKRYPTIYALLIIALICSIPVSSSAQKRRVKSKSPATSAPSPAADMRSEAMQVGEQIKNISKFIFIYGKIVNGLEIAEEQAKTGKSSPEIDAKNKQTRDALVANITGLKTGMDNLVKTFQANPRLQVQYLKISYAAEAVTNAQQLAASGQYNDAGKQLVTAVDRLTDAITSMRLI